MAAAPRPHVEPPCDPRLPLDEVLERIAAARAKLGERVLILGHHYQRDEVYRFADLAGDSLALARQVSAHRDAEFIVFCGVHFMAETADILATHHQIVILPDPGAGCTLADMADLPQVERAYRELAEAGIDPLPVAYVNSTAALKALTGERGGAICTSSNAGTVFRWALEQERPVLTLPDQHLGRNTFHRMGIGLDEMALWDPAQPLGGLTPERARAARVLLWKGHCAVHQQFTVAQVERWRRQNPAIQVIVHPECSFDVVQTADLVGSTEFIRSAIADAEPGSAWAIGTEHHLVNRLAAQYPDRFITTLTPFACQCATMFRIDPRYLMWVLEELVEGRVRNAVSVPVAQARQAIVALERMLALS